MFNPGQRVRCINAAGVASQMQVGDEFTIDKMGVGKGEFVFLTHRPNTPFYTHRFEAVVTVEAPAPAVMIARWIVGQEAVFTNVKTRDWYGKLEGVQQNRVYTIRDVRGDKVQINNPSFATYPWYSSSRLSADPALIERARQAKSVPREKPGVSARIDPFVGCCGARALYFGGGFITRPNLKATVGHWKNGVGVPMAVAVLNRGQFNGPNPTTDPEAGHNLMLEFGFQHVGETASNGGQELHLYMLAHKKSSRLKAVSTEPVRAFG